MADRIEYIEKDDDAPADIGGRELYYVDADGEKQDAELWDDLLGDDTEGTWDPSKGDVPPSLGTDDTGDGPAPSPLAQVHGILSQQSPHYDPSSGRGSQPS